MFGPVPQFLGSQASYLESADVTDFAKRQQKRAVIQTWSCGFMIISQGKELEEAGDGMQRRTLIICLGMLTFLRSILGGCLDLKRPF